jgi:hypothetical protein
MAFQVEARTDAGAEAPVAPDPREALPPLSIVIVGKADGMWRHSSNTIQLLLKVLRMGYMPE